MPQKKRRKRSLGSSSLEAYLPNFVFLAPIGGRFVVMSSYCSLVVVIILACGFLIDE